MSHLSPLPKPRVAETETKKRIIIIESIIAEFAKCSEAVVLTGLMAYGQDYSVTPESGIDFQLLITPELIPKLGSCKYFQKYNTERIGEGFIGGVFQHFTLNFVYKEIPISCHFWDEKTMKEMLLYKKEKITRLRSQAKKTATIHAYSFDGQIHTEEYADYRKENYNVGDMPVFTTHKNTLFLSRPITNILGNAIVLFDACGFSEIINECRAMTEEKIAETKQEDGKTYSILNTIEEREKIAPDVEIMLI